MSNGTPQKTPDITVISTIYGAVTPAGSTLGQVKVVGRKIRLRVLDCRSGLPISQTNPDIVLIDGQEALRFFGDIAWDFTKNFIIPVHEGGKNDGFPLDWTGFKEGNWRALQMALNALGQNCGTPSANIGPKTLTALQAFEDAWYSDHPSEQKPDKFKFPAKDANDWVKRIIAAYNEKFYRAVQLYLSGLGYPCESDDGKWKDDSKKALVLWQKVELGTANPDLDSFNTAEKKKRARLQVLAGKLKDARKKFFTDPDGVLWIPAPVEKVRGGFKLKVSFPDFALILEEDGLRASPNAQPTQFGIEWQDGTQDKSAGNWCWRLRPPAKQDANKYPRASLPEFQYFLQMQVPPAPTLSWRDVASADLKNAKFSPFFTSQTADQVCPEFVAFALVWCQVVFDNLNDPTNEATTRHYINTNVYVDPDAEDSVRGRHMHIVTMAHNGEHGKNYGKIEKLDDQTLCKYRIGKNHPGIDLYAPVGSKVFAVHGGTAIRYQDDDGGNVLQVSWMGEGRTSLACLHFSQYVAAHKSHVKAGEVIGLAGRTGNLGLVSQYPGHTHLNMGAHDYVAELQETPDAANRVCIPTNATPLVFPCRCQVTQPDANPKDCKFDIQHVKFVKDCWTVSELRCPEMWGAGRTDLRLQAQLRYLTKHANGTGPYLDPGDTDGSLGSVPTAKSQQISNSRQAIRAFRVANQLTAADAAAPEGYEMDDAAWNLLDQLAPVEKPQT